MRLIRLTGVLMILTAAAVFGGGKIYLVIGSDTAIWTGMDVSRYNCFYDQALYTDPNRNAAKVMDPAFRASMLDSYGNTMKLTWWMMAGNIFRYAVNTNMPVPNIMTMYFMKKYHGENVIINGDELSLHYHTFFWSDYDQDGKYYWNQSLTFNESLDDFKVTLAQLLLEENVFPVSFRSGWHFMDNGWQSYLDNYVLPFSFHNDFPAVRTDTTEPLDNTFDWKRSPATFKPFRPSPFDYRIPGNGKAWNVRSASFPAIKSKKLIDSIYIAAASGEDQMLCIWGHLPETDFLDNLQYVDSMMHLKAPLYPDVTFKYCTAVEAMQIWLQAPQEESPVIGFAEHPSTGGVKLEVTSDRTIFQNVPFVALMDRYGRYSAAEMIGAGTNKWVTAETYEPGFIARAAVSVCDNYGRQTNKHIGNYPAVIYIDNEDAGYNEILGTWSTQTSASWGLNSRSSENPASASWNWAVTKSLKYNIFVQIPEQSLQNGNQGYILKVGGVPVDTIIVDYSGDNFYRWNYLGTLDLDEGETLEIQTNTGLTGSVRLVCDAVRIDPYVSDRELLLSADVIDFGEVAANDTVFSTLRLRNAGVEQLTITGISLPGGVTLVNGNQSFVIPSMGERTIEFSFSFAQPGGYSDSVFIFSNDQYSSIRVVPVNAVVKNYFRIVDNEDNGSYFESGNWATSVAQAWGPTSRFAFLDGSPRAKASFAANLEKSGEYEVMYIVPVTTNSTDKAIYTIKNNGATLGAKIINQNLDSGGWVSLGVYSFEAGDAAEVEVKDEGGNTVGDVLRADAVRFNLMEGVSGTLDELTGMPEEYRLYPNYPNPFNPLTIINYDLKERSHIRITVYDVLGREVALLADKEEAAGMHTVKFNAAGLTSGIYFYTMSTRSADGQIFSDVKKMMLLK